MSTHAGPVDARAAALARYYDLDHLDDPGDVPLYEALARRTGGPVLELAAGSGRVAVPLALAGHHVVALDIDPAMLSRAERRWTAVRGRRPAERLRLVEADLLTADLGARFGLVVLALNSLLLLPEEGAQEAALRTMAAHLRPGGLAVVDVFLPDAADLALYDGRLQLDWLREDPETGQLVAKTASARHDAASGSVELVQWFDATPAAGGPVERTVRRDRMRLVSARELVTLAECAGLVVEDLAGDHQATPFGPGAERAVLLARSV